MSNLVKIAGGFGTLLAFSGPYLSQNIFLDSWRSFYQLYKDGCETSLDGKSKELINEVSSNDRIQFFFSSVQVPVYKGSSSSQAIVGLPGNFVYTKKDEMGLDAIVLPGNKNIDFATRSGQMFAESIVLSDDAKKFLIARQVEYTNSNHILVRSLVQGLSAVLVTGVCLYAGRFTSRMKRRWQYGIYGAVCTLGLSISVAVFDLYRCRLDHNVDTIVAALGPDFARGGLQYYEQTLEMNKALRSLMGDWGESTYTVYGNARNQTIRSAEAPLTVRRDILKNIQAQSN